MRFKIDRVPTSQEILDFAFKEARKASPAFSKRIRKKERWAKEIEKNKIEQVSALLDEKLRGISNSFPQFDGMAPFERELVDASINISETKQQLASLKKAGGLVRRLRSQTIQAIFKTNSSQTIRRLSNAFYGRTSSMVNKTNSRLKALEEKRKKLLELPSIRTDCYTAVLAGFPNVGKTTLLKKLTNSEPRIASFPFTTQSLKIGYFEFKYFPIQLVDTPGLLDRPNEKKNPIEKKAVAALRHLGQMVLFVIDPSLSSGFSLEQQVKLFKEIEQQFRNRKIVPFITKKDLCTPEQLEEAGRLFSNAAACNTAEELRTLIQNEAQQWIRKQIKRDQP